MGNGRLDILWSLIVLLGVFIGGLVATLLVCKLSKRNKWVVLYICEVRAMMPADQ